ncbi:damage-inducible protein D [Cesiribacter sp. SM1]|uniref:damage-inducible protein D n=1 Tax=Cesiribacter sp. SM1 TaxID=2861196 RepID=UPI001CD6C0EC|nr:damage-inducible protein D [Cesiribacter sp. SM1]
MLVHIQVDQSNNPHFESFLHSLQESKLLYYASELQKILDLPSLLELEEALRRAMEVCRSQHLELAEHFKPVYRCEETGVVKDWKLSPLAWCLVLINANPKHPEVSRMQLALIGKSFNGQ